MSSNNYKVDLARVFRTNGYLLPANEDEVLAFEKHLEPIKETPRDWDDPIQIIKRGKKYNIPISNSTPDNDTVSNLAMAARDGKEITDAVRKKMNDDRRNSSNK